ncbi:MULTISPECIES: FAD-dependent oxidoreductase [Paraburkholderia]|jgi:thioredoxin reductase (NADPH)|uniref:Thioredoxin reductase n=1 Tax=Paraburkholderia largidicola TaxID=3014751 RepID=A0A7I8BTT8_9BURK|nr:MULTISPECIES: FAD-dependent oxidoreductase [Paraburkholderia]BEU23352.1 FAD-dependent oxidoreductase [Paraburkholderia sp. 22B1P]GJH35573.1 FAD-dependent oxidoreductase [Paraburkholderia hospita]CAG9241049.1 Thioredoxin reductase [Paraburkholderia caribensis]BCF91943.1 thioredoxin reductase [Paraburkholderia sp. PGU16]GJH06528.1 FAD-dependent oxidoreductase [Paraburkholderia terrae]
MGVTREGEDAQRAAVNEAPFSTLSTRRHQMFPILQPEEIKRLCKFGERRNYEAGEMLFLTGTTGPGMVVVLKGSVKVYQRDGLGRELLVNEHHQGSFLAEVGQLSGKPALVDGMALEHVEALLISPERLRALIVAEAELGERIMRALILRRVGLIERGAGGPIIVGKSNDRRLVSLQGFLARNGHPHTVLDERDEDGLRVIEQFAAGPEDMPLVICPDGSVLRHPSDPELATCLGLIPDLDSEHVYDVAIVGAGPAGLATAVYAASEGLSVIVLDSRAPGGQAGASSRIENYLGFPTGISGQALAGRAFVQAQKFGAHVAIPVKVKHLHCEERPYRLELQCQGSIRAQTIVIASGAVYRRPEIDGLDRFDGRGIYYWASPVEAKLCKREEIVLVGGGNSAGQGIVYLASHAKHIHVLIRRSGFEATMSRYLIDRIASLPNVTVYPDTEIGWLEGNEGGLEQIGLKNPCADGRDCFDSRHLFLFTGADPNTDWLRSCGVELDKKGFVITGANSACDLNTSVEGVYAIGDARAGSTKRVAAAVGEGAQVVAQIHQMLAQLAGETTVALGA